MTLEKEHEKYWKCPERTCKLCTKYPCFRGQKNLKSDFAKYGCRHYSEAQQTP